MNDLQKMQSSCVEFAKDLKTVGVVWLNVTRNGFSFCIKANIKFIGVISLWLDDEDCCFKMENHLMGRIALQSTTAKEAAIEALDLVRKEAQKLVDALTEPKEGNTVEKFIEKAKKQMEGEPKEPFWIPIDNNIETLPQGDVLAKSEDGRYLEGVLKFSEKCTFVFCFNEEKRFVLTNLTHYHKI